MALIKDYEIQGTGVTVPNAYHVITDLKIHKRVNDIKPPRDETTESGYTNEWWEEGTELFWQKGYTCRIFVTIWKDKQSREDDIKPIGVAGLNTTEMEADIRIGTEGLDERCEFMLDMDSTDTDLVQAYNHLKSLDFYAGCTED